jgi:hypothetical protein
MRGMLMSKGYLLLSSITIIATGVVAGCASGPPLATFVDGQEHMPAPATLWLTADPAAPVAPVTIALTTPDSPDFLRSHTFPAGVDLRADVPVSAGRYRLTAVEPGCSFDVSLGPERETDLVLRLGDDGTCEFRIAAEHGSGDVLHGEPAVLVAPDGGPRFEPSTTEAPSGPSR